MHAFLRGWFEGDHRILLLELEWVFEVVLHDIVINYQYEPYNYTHPPFISQLAAVGVL